MIDPHVRPGAVTDAAELVELEAAARTALIDARGGARWLEEHRPIASRWGERVEAGGVFVAALTHPAGDPLVVGFVCADLGGSVARIEQIYVRPEARELGFGDALLATATAAARAAGARVLEGEALPGDRATKNLYERAGITARLITVSTRL